MYQPCNVALTTQCCNHHESHSSLFIYHRLRVGGYFISFFPSPVGVCLKQDDLCTIHTELYPARLKWYDLGLKLGVSVAVLNQIRQMFSSPSDCLLEVLQHWLQSSPHPTWEEMCTALRSRTVGEHPLAQQLEEVFVPVADSGAEDGGEG